MPKGKKNKPPPPPAERTASPPPMRIASPPPPPPHAERTASLPRNIWGRLQDAGIGWYEVVQAIWKDKSGENEPPKNGAKLIIPFLDDSVPTEHILALRPDQLPPGLQPIAPPQTLGLSPITTIEITPAPPLPQPLRLSPMTPTTNYEAQPYHVSRHGAGGNNTDSPGTNTEEEEEKRREKRFPSPAALPAAPTTSTPDPQTNPGPRPRTRPQTSPPRPRTRSPTSNYGIVVHGIALRKDLDKVRRWLETANKEIGQTRGIRWLRKKAMLAEEGKKTSSVVLYLETQIDVEKVKLGGRWLRAEVYEPSRGRK